MSGGVPASNNSVMPPIRKEWPVMCGYPAFCHISLHLCMNRCLVRCADPWGVLYVKSDELWLMQLRQRWLFRLVSGLVQSERCVRMTVWPLIEVFMQGRLSVKVRHCLCDCRRCRCVEMCAIGEWFKFGKSSPSLHCPQKAMAVQVLTAMSKLESRFRLSQRSSIMALLMGILGGRVENEEERRETLLRT